MKDNKNSGKIPMKPLTFEGTILANSYLPIFIDSKIKKKNETITIGNEFSVVANIYSSLLESMYLQPVALKGFEARSIWDFIKTSLKRFTKEQELQKLKAKFNGFVVSSKKNFANYEETHETNLQNIIHNIDVINRQKTLMKDYLLQKLYVKLQKMGFDCTFSDFQVEHIDLRDFPLNHNYDIVCKENLSIIELSTGTLNDIIIIINGLNPLNFLFIRFHNSKEIKCINDKLRELERKEKYNTAQMNSDLTLTDELNCALNNISCIYKDLMDTLMPIMENLLYELSVKYDNDFSKMPEQKVQAIRKIKDLLKDLSETIILPSKNKIERMKDEIVEFSNNLSSQHYILKAEILNVES